MPASASCCSAALGRVILVLPRPAASRLETVEPGSPRLPSPCRPRQRYSPGVGGSGGKGRQGDRMAEVDQLRLRVKQLEALHELAAELMKLEDYDQLLDAVVCRALEILPADRGFLVLKRHEELDFAVVRNWSRSELEDEREPVSR